MSQDIGGEMIYIHMTSKKYSDGSLNALRISKWQEKNKNDLDNNQNKIYLFECLFPGYKINNKVIPMMIKNKEKQIYINMSYTIH